MLKSRSSPPSLQRNDRGDKKAKGPKRENCFKDQCVLGDLADVQVHPMNCFKDALVDVEASRCFVAHVSIFLYMIQHVDGLFIVP